MSSIKDPRSSEGYKPRFELWMNVFLHQALANTINSMAGMEVTTTSTQGMMVSEVRVPIDRLIWNVKILRALVLQVWRKKDELADFDKMVDGINIEDQPDEYFHCILELFNKRGMLRFRVPRSFGGPRSE